MFAVRVVEVKEYLTGEKPSDEKVYYDLYDAQTVVEIEVKNLMKKYDGAMLTKSGDIYVVVTRTDEIFHVYSCDPDRRIIMRPRPNMALSMSWYDRVYAEHRDSFDWVV